jgi:putative tryptophan/tyrosine transport system substrate-binding protein
MGLLADAARKPRSVKFHTPRPVGRVVACRFERVLTRRGDRMNRRDIVVCLLSSVTPLGRAHAQQTGKVYHVAVISPNTQPSEMSEASPDQALARAWGAFFGELRQLGYVEGKNLVVERYSGEGRVERFRELASNVIRRNPDLIYTVSPDMLLAFKAATTTIPIVGLTGDPVALGIVPSLSRPGGNITGSSVDAGPDIWGKRLEILNEAIPKLSRLGFIITTTSWGKVGLMLLTEALRERGISFVGSPLHSPISEAVYRQALATMAQEGADAVFVGDEPEHFTHLRLIAELAEKARLPTVYAWREGVEAGGFMAYAFELLDLIRHNADMIAKIFAGARPGDIPFYQARKFELSFNLKTAKALGIAIPGSLLARADAVIE